MNALNGWTIPSKSKFVRCPDTEVILISHAWPSTSHWNSYILLNFDKPSFYKVRYNMILVRVSVFDA